MPKGQTGQRSTDTAAPITLSRSASSISLSRAQNTEVGGPLKPGFGLSGAVRLKQGVPRASELAAEIPGGDSCELGLPLSTGIPPPPVFAQTRLFTSPRVRAMLLA